MSERKAVQLRRTRAFRLLVWAIRCGPVALVLGGLTTASTLVEVSFLTAALAVCMVVFLVPAVVLAFIGMTMLYDDGLMPRDMARRRAMRHMLWRDAVRPLKRP